MSVFTAMMMDSYRELNSKRLFWVILGISGLIVVYFASIGFDDKGMTMFFGLSSIENPVLTRGSIISQIVYRSIFSSFIVGIWLAWIATILALISTTTIFPDFMAGGTIDLVLSKPISRIRLFALKYISSLLFVLLQVSLFCTGIFFCMGLRLGDWEWKIFAAIPLVVLFYSYLFSINVLIGVWTRSALTALLVTFLFWVSLFGITASETVLNQIKTDMVVQAEEVGESIDHVETTLATVRSRDSGNDALATARLESQLTSLKKDRDDKTEMVAKLERWQKPTRLVQMTLPKTSETIALLDRWLKKDTDVNLLDVMRGNAALDAQGRPVRQNDTRSREVERRLEAEYEARSEWYITGSSLLFELVVLSLACFLFVRRDY